MPRVQDAEIRRVTGLVTKISPEDIGTTHAKVLQNYDPDPIGVLSRRPGSHIAEVTDHLGDAVDAAWWTAQWGANDVNYILGLPIWPPMLPAVYNPANRKPGGRLIIGGGGKVAEGGGAEIGDAVPSPDLDRYFDVEIPAHLSNGNPFDVTVTAKKPDGTTDTAFTGPVTVVLSSWGTGAIEKTFVQNTAPAAVSWTNGVAVISCTVTATRTSTLVAAGGTFMKVKAIYGRDGRGPTEGESDRGWLTATGYFTVVASVSSVDIGTAFTLTVTAYDSDGAVDTAHAAAATISDDNASVSLSDTAIGAGDWTNGVAVISETFSGTLTAGVSVKVTVEDDANVPPSGQSHITVNATVSAPATWS